MTAVNLTAVDLNLQIPCYAVDLAMADSQDRDISLRNSEASRHPRFCGAYVGEKHKRINCYSHSSAVPTYVDVDA